MQVLNILLHVNTFYLLAPCYTFVGDLELLTPALVKDKDRMQK